MRSEVGRPARGRALTATLAVLAGLGLLAAPGTAVAASPQHATSSGDRVARAPAAPTRLRASRRATGPYLTWTSKSSTGFAVTQATNAGMTQNVRIYKVLGDTHQFTPPGLIRGRRYYYRVRALNHAKPSAPSTTAVVTGSAQQSVRVMTYNILELTADGHREGTGVIAPWSKRKVAAASLIQAAQPDAVAIEEGAPWVGRPRGARQVDSLRAALGGTYALSHTEVSPNQPRYFRTGVYVLYKKSAYRAVGHSWHWALGNNHFAAYQILENRRTHAKFLFVAVHLEVGRGASQDQMRENETKVLLRKAGGYAAQHHVPVVYAGDFNSDHTPAHAFDGPGRAMRAADVVSAYNAAVSRRLGRYNSANGYNRTPPKFGDHIDYIYAPPGVAVRSWRLVMRLAHGRLVGVIPSDHNPVVADLEIPY